MGLDLGTALAAIWRRRFLILAVAVAAAAAAYALSSRQDDEYQATAKLLFRSDQLGPVLFGGAPPETDRAPDRTAATNIALASLDTVAVRVKRQLRSPLALDDLRERVEVRPEGQADIVQIVSKEKSRSGAVTLANAFAEAVVELRRDSAQERVQNAIDAIRRQVRAGGFTPSLRRELRLRANQLRVLRALRTGDVELLERARPPDGRSGPFPAMDAAVGGFVGLVLALFLVLLAARLDRRVRDESELESAFDAPILARIPATRRAREGDERPVAEAFQFLKANLQLLDPDGGPRAFAVVSPLPGDGKTTVVSGLARAFARSGLRTIAVDCDLRRPALHTALDVPSEEGVVNALVGRRDALDLLQDTAEDGLRVLPAGPVLAGQSPVALASERLPELLGRLGQEADCCIVDTPPLGTAADASLLAGSVDGVILVVDLGRLRREQLAITRNQLATAGVELLGVVLNRVDPKSAGFGDAYYAYGDRAPRGRSGRPAAQTLQS